LTDDGQRRTARVHVERKRVVPARDHRVQPRRELVQLVAAPRLRGAMWVRRGDHAHVFTCAEVSPRRGSDLLTRPIPFASLDTTPLFQKRVAPPSALLGPP